MTSASKGGTKGTGATNGRYPWFDSASIKPNDAPAAGIRASGNEFVTIEPAIDIIMFAYGEQQGPLKPVQVSGGPDWMKTEVFNIDAELPKSLSDQIEPPLRSGPALLLYPAEERRTDAVKAVFRSLLINRFKLRVRHETKVLPVYELVLAENGPRIAKDKTGDGPCRITDIAPGNVPAPFPLPWMDVRSCDFDTFAGLLSTRPELTSRVLVDQTGLHGRYSFMLHWTRKAPAGMPMPTIGGQANNSAELLESSRASLLTALQEQLGLTLKSTTAPVDTIVIQHIENPAQN
ncbi:MAG TPA: TIGR03435 family protein [Candidatus Aquilonibacter sp.]|nr:TIGR03435 family protein [Candidatus Aquilonibacter sp.]